MNDKRYEMKIITRGPLFIGSGVTIDKNEYIYVENKGQVYFVDQRKFVKYLERKDLFEDFLKYMSNGNEKTKDLYSFLKNNNITSFNDFTESPIDVHQGKIEGKKGKYDRGDGVKKLNEINRFVRNSRGEIYVPRSSIKGMLRTILLENIDDDKYDNQLFKNILVSDSQIIEDKHLAIYQKMDLGPKKINPMPLYRECIDVDTEIITTLIIKDMKDLSINIETIKKRISEFFNSYLDYSELIIFDEKSIGAKSYLNKSKNIDYDDKLFAYLGGGVGFVSKTLYYSTYNNFDKAKEDSLNILSKKFDVYKTYNDQERKTLLKGNIPIDLKVTINNRNKIYYEFGLVEIEFKEIL